MFKQLTRVVIFGALALTASLMACAVATDEASAYSAGQHRAITFISSHVDVAVHVADTASAAATANGNGDWQRAIKLIRHSSNDYAKLHRQWLAVPVAGGAVERLERQFDALLNNIGVYGTCVAKSIAGDGSSANVVRGLKAWDRALVNLSNVLIELEVL